MLAMIEVKPVCVGAAIWILATCCGMACAEVIASTVNGVVAVATAPGSNTADSLNGARPIPLLDLQDAATEAATSAHDLLKAVGPMSVDPAAAGAGAKLLDGDQLTDFTKGKAANWMAGRAGMPLGPTSAGTGSAESSSLSQANLPITQETAPAAEHEHESDRAASVIRPLVNYLREHRYSMLTGGVLLLAILWGYSSLYSPKARTLKSRRGEVRRSSRKMPLVVLPVKEHSHRPASHSRRRSSNRSAARRGRSADPAADTGVG